MFVMLTAVAACADRTVAPPSGSSTGIAVAPEFASFYNEMGGLPILGYPLTNSYFDEESGRFVQYFQRIRLEYDPTRPPGDKIVIAPIGEWAYAGVRSVATVAAPENSQQRYFPETDLTVFNGFLRFYETRQGERLLGPPISPQLDEGSKRVQYFRNATLEWRPEAPLNHRVQLGLLGESHFYNSGAILRYTQEQLAAPVDSAGVRSVNVSAAVRAPILYTGDEQTIYVEVKTTDDNPVRNISVQLEMFYNNDSHPPINLGNTDDSGKIQQVIPLETAAPGQLVEVIVRVYADDGTVIGSTTLSFKTWW